MFVQFVILFIFGASFQFFCFVLFLANQAINTYFDRRDLLWICFCFSDRNIPSEATENYMIHYYKDGVY